MPDSVHERNVATVKRFYQSERDRDLRSWVGFWRSDGKQTFPTLGPAATVAGIAQLEAVTKEKFDTRPPYGIDDRVEAYADPSKVFAALDLDFPGRAVVTIWCVFHFDESGQVVEVEEIFDRATAFTDGEQ